MAADIGGARRLKARRLFPSHETADVPDDLGHVQFLTARQVHRLSPRLLFLVKTNQPPSGVGRIEIVPRLLAVPEDHRGLLPHDSLDDSRDDPGKIATVLARTVVVEWATDRHVDMEGSPVGLDKEGGCRLRGRIGGLGLQRVFLVHRDTLRGAIGLRRRAVNEGLKGALAA